MSEATKNREHFGDDVPFPISRAVRAGDFVITSALADRVFSIDETLYDAHGHVISAGLHLKDRSFADEVHGTFREVKDALALADCTLDEVIDTQVWLKDPRDFAEFNRIYAGYFKTNKPVRSVFRTEFMLDFRVEIKVTAYKPL